MFVACDSSVPVRLTMYNDWPVGLRLVVRRVACMLLSVLVGRRDLCLLGLLFRRLWWDALLVAFPVVEKPAGWGGYLN